MLRIVNIFSSYFFGKKFKFMFRGIVLFCVSYQSCAFSVVPEENQFKLTIAIVGFGNFGKFIAKRLVDKGHHVLISERPAYIDMKKIDEIGITDFYHSPEQMLIERSKEIDILLIATSIISFESVVESLPVSLLENKLVVDVLSVKAHPKKVLERVLPKNVDFICSHPMFGPESGKDSWQGLNFMFEKNRVSEQNEIIFKVFIDFFESQGCNIVQMSSEDHDFATANSQFIVHLNNRVLSKLDLKDTMINTKSYELLLQAVLNTANDTDDLFKGLYLYNPFTKVVMDNYVKAVNDINQEIPAWNNR